MNKQISDFLSQDPAITIHSGATVSEAVSVMTSEKHNYVLIEDNNDIVGIFTDRDLLNRVLSEQLLPDEVKIRDVMTPDPELLEPSDYIAYAMERMARYGYRNIPIKLDEGGIAVLTVWNVMSHISDILIDVEEQESDLDMLNEITDIGGGG
jgi:CBS domain-containing protein